MMAGLSGLELQYLGNSSTTMMTEIGTSDELHPGRYRVRKERYYGLGIKLTRENKTADAR